MYVHSVKLINYRSIGEYDESEVILEPRVTAIIGKNESGKSNVLEGLSKVNFLSINPNIFAENLVNRCNRSPIKYVIVLKPSNTDLQKLKICADTEIEISETIYRVTGGLLEYFQNNVVPVFCALVETLEEIGKNPWAIKDTNEFNGYRAQIKNLSITDNIDVPKIGNALASLSRRIASSQPGGKQELKELIAAAEEHWHSLKAIFPVFFYRKADKHLKNTYKFEDVQKELSNPNTNPNSLLSDYVRLIGISKRNIRSKVSERASTMTCELSANLRCWMSRLPKAKSADILLPAEPSMFLN